MDPLVCLLPSDQSCLISLIIPERKDFVRDQNVQQDIDSVINFLSMLCTGFRAKAKRQEGILIVLLPCEREKIHFGKMDAIEKFLRSPLHGFLKT
ncbi:hypothetical protein M514_01214 [Trichuris suis]|uniref:Uncharacterized protein n=1 Tax=Trichuris suis TaxID=68888 RepID=A0A085NMY7_9BILA|nr:hypothetical protein M513_01214 [Trichuris suis]KFD70833.1 hypothetical protein M514_01214 [Trichuris suis]